MKLSITTAWNETAAFVKHEAGALILIIFALGVLPGLILQAIASRLVPSLQITPATTPDLRPFVTALPIIFLLLIPVLVLSVWGNLTVNVLALRRETVIGGAFGRAARRILPLLGASMLFAIVAALVMLPVLGFLAAGIATNHAGPAALLLFIVWLAFVFVAVRLMLMTPIAAAETVGPVGIIRRSWQLTSGHFWKLLGFIVLLMLVFLVLLLVVGSVGGILVTLVAGKPDPGTLSSFLIQLIMGVLQAVVFTYFIVMIARIYEQLSGNAASVGQVFQ
jgi:hypothetical protein